MCICLGVGVMCRFTSLLLVLRLGCDTPSHPHTPVTHSPSPSPSPSHSHSLSLPPHPPTPTQIIPLVIRTAGTADSGGFIFGFMVPVVCNLLVLQHILVKTVLLRAVYELVRGVDVVRWV